MGIMTELERLFQEYMATPDDGVEVDAPPMQLRPGLQPCGHPVQAIRSMPYIGEQHSNWCGWCADVARLGEALEWALVHISYPKYIPALAEEDEKRLAQQWKATIGQARAALSTPTNDCLAQHDAEVRAQERERCVRKCREVEAYWRKQANRHNLGIDYGRRDGAIFCVAAIHEQEDEHHVES